MCFDDLVNLKSTGITIWLMLLDILIKEISMEGAKQAAACLGFQVPDIFVVFVTVSPCPAHSHQGIPIDK